MLTRDIIFESELIVPPYSFQRPSTRHGIELRSYRNLTVSGPHSFLFHGGVLLSDYGIYPKFALDILQGEDGKRFQQFFELPVRTIEEECVVFQNWDVRTWGHFLIFMLPRLFYAKVAGVNLRSVKILITSETPNWQVEIIKSVFSVEDANFVRFAPRSEQCLLRRAIVTSLPLNESGFHSSALLAFSDIADAALGRSAPRNSILPKHIFIDREGYRAKSFSYRRSLSNYNEVFEISERYLAGIVAIEPSSLTFGEQISLFRGLKCVVGEYGSGLHNTIFSDAGCKILSIGRINTLQDFLCKLKGQEVIFVDAEMSEGYCLDTRIFENAVRRLLEMI